MSEFDPTGTGLKLGDINISAGKHGQIFGNFAGENLHREFASRLKEGLDNYTNSNNTNSNNNSNNTNNQDLHMILLKDINGHQD